MDSKENPVVRLSAYDLQNAHDMAFHLVRDVMSDGYQLFVRAQYGAHGYILHRAEGTRLSDVVSTADRYSPLFILSPTQCVDLFTQWWRLGIRSEEFTPSPDLVAAKDQQIMSLKDEILRQKAFIETLKDLLNQNLALIAKLIGDEIT